MQRGGSLVNPDWEQSPMNTSKYYLKSPVYIHTKQSGFLDKTQDKFLSRTFNRRLKMADTFTKIVPSYEHVPRTCYNIDSHMHHVFKEHKRDSEGIPLSKVSKINNHRMDEIKNYSEEMYKLGPFAPPKRVAANKV